MQFHIPNIDVNKIYELEGNKYTIDSFSVGPNTPENGCWINCCTLGFPDYTNECFSSEFWNANFKEKITEWIPIDCQFTYNQKLRDKHTKNECQVNTLGYHPFTNTVWYNNTLCDKDAILAEATVGFMCTDT